MPAVGRLWPSVFDYEDTLIHSHLVADRRLNLNELKETFHLKKVKMKKNENLKAHPGCLKKVKMEKIKIKN